MLTYHIQSLDQAIKAFNYYSYQKFTDTHDTFLNLIQFIKTKDLQSLINATDKALTKIFKQFLVDPAID